MRTRRPVDLNDSDLHVELANIERRLRDGEDKVRQAKEVGEWGAVERWETAWIRMLRQYELLYDRLQFSQEGDAPLRSSGQNG